MRKKKKKKNFDFEGTFFSISICEGCNKHLLEMACSLSRPLRVCSPERALVIYKAIAPVVAVRIAMGHAAVYSQCNRMLHTYIMLDKKKHTSIDNARP